MGCGNSRPSPSASALQRLHAAAILDEQWTSSGGTMPSTAAEAKRATRLDLSGCTLTPMHGATLSAALPLLGSLEVLNVSGCGLREIGVSMLAAGLEKNAPKKLASLWVANSFAGAETAAALSAALSVEGLKHLTSLNLSNNSLGGQGALALAHALEKRRPPLAELLLADCQLGFSGGEAIGAAAAKLTTLRRLDLFCSQVGDKGAVAVGNGVMRAGIVCISLQACAVTYDGAIALAAGWRESDADERIETLDLSSNAIGMGYDHGCQALSEALTARPPRALTLLNLAENSLADGDPTGLLRSLGAATSLTWLDLSSNRLRSEAGEPIAAALLSLARLVTLGLNDNPKLGDEGMLPILRAASTHLPQLAALHAGNVGLELATADARAAALEVLRRAPPAVPITRLELRGNRGVPPEVCDDLRAAAATSANPPALRLPGDDLQGEMPPSALDSRKMDFEYLGSRVFLHGNDDGGERNQAPVSVAVGGAAGAA